MKLQYVLLSLISLLFSWVGIAAQDDYSVYLIGDSGDPRLEGSDPVFSNLKKRLDQEGKNSTIVFLGDNIYHNGLPPEDKDEKDRALAEKKILVQLDALSDYKGEVYFIPGNHDWNAGKPDGIDYITEQEEFIEFYLDRGDVLIPDHGCPGPEKKNLTDNIVLLALDSQWWLHPHKDGDKENSDCKNKNYYQVIQELKEMLDKHDDEIIIIALHHPLYSDGSHNGFFTLKDHLFPISSLAKNWYLPLPGIGSLYPFYRSTFGVSQDMPHPSYVNLRKEILNAVAGYKNVIFASGHEHNLQYFYKDENHFIKSGSGSKSSPLPNITDAGYSAENKGYAHLKISEKGGVLLSYMTIDKEGKETVSFQQQIIKGPAEIPDFVTEPYTLASETTARAANSDYLHGGIHNMVFGKVYRKDWAAINDFRNINLSTEKGGLRPIKTGGGYSSNSLRLENPNKEEYVLRSIQKGVSKVVPEPFRGSFVQKIFQDQIAGSQPYAALAVPPLANAAGVYHTNPEIVYLPRQEALGDFNDFYAEDLYLFEERPAGDRKDEDSFGNSKKIISYSKLIDKVQSSPDHHIHQDQVLRSRLFDIYLGDWDRHDDQWRWASFKEDHHDHTDENEDHMTFYEPIPRDRDQVFFKYQGFVPWLTKVLSPELRKFQSYDKTIKNVKYLGYNARHFDRSFLNRMSRLDWITEAKSLQSKLTDQAIEASISNLPLPIQQLEGDFYREAMQQRRSDLVTYAEDYYDFLSKYVDVVGTHKKEKFIVTRHPDNTTHVIVKEWSKKTGEGATIYERTFPEGETKEIRLYGLKGDDIFDISGENKRAPIIRIIGGKGEDTVNDSSNLKGLRKSVLAYDSRDNNTFNLGVDSRDKRSDEFLENQYDRKEFYYNAPIGLVLLGYNPDDGLVLSYSQSIKTYGFRKAPYKFSHTYKLRYAFNTKEMGLGYELGATDVIGKTDMSILIDALLPSDVNNFFGIGNDIELSDFTFDSYNYFRYKQTNVLIWPSLKWHSPNDFHTIKIGPYYRYTELDENENRLIEDPGVNLNPIDLENKNYTGLALKYVIERIDNKLEPNVGMRFIFEPSYNINLGGTKEKFTKLNTSLTLYNYLWIPRPLVLASKVSFGLNIGDYSFFQANYIGRESGLRSFRQNRFGGDRSFSVSNDLRIKLFTSQKGSIAFSMGLMGSYDIGRVWQDDVSSDTWHQSYGGGLWINPFDVMPVSFYYMTSPAKESLFLVKFGFAI